MNVWTICVCWPVCVWKRAGSPWRPSRIAARARTCMTAVGRVDDYLRQRGEAGREPERATRPRADRASQRAAGRAAGRAGALRVPARGAVRARLAEGDAVPARRLLRLVPRRGGQLRAADRDELDPPDRLARQR